MPRKKHLKGQNRTVADRQKSLQPRSPETHVTLAGARAMYAGITGEEFPCVINGYCRTQIFEFPSDDFHPDADEPHHEIHTSPSVQACVASDLPDYFESSTSSTHYAISPSLRSVVGETYEKVKAQQANRVPVFLVIEEFEQLAPVEMVKGECCISSEVIVRDGAQEPMIVGG